MKALLAAAVALILPIGVARAQTMGNPPGQMGNPSVAPNTPGNTSGAPTGATTNPATAPTSNSYGALGASAQIGDERTTPDDTRTEAGMSKDQLINKLHHVNQMEIQMGTLAQKNAHNSKVKSYGATLVKDHTKADKLVTSFAKDNQITFAESTSEQMGSTQSADHAAKMQAKKEKMDRLSDLHGDAFDKEFLTMMAEDHQHVINVLEATKGRDADKKLDQLIDKLLPTIRDHQRTAERLGHEVPSST